MLGHWLSDNGSILFGFLVMTVCICGFQLVDTQAYAGDLHSLIQALDKNTHSHHPGNSLGMYWKRIKPS